MSEKEKFTRLAAINRFFSLNTEKPLTSYEVKALNEDEKNELATLCAEALGVELISMVAASATGE